MGRREYICRRSTIETKQETRTKTARIGKSIEEMKK